MALLRAEPELTESARWAHRLRRVGFAVRPGATDRLAGTDPIAWVGEQLDAAAASALTSANAQQRSFDDGWSVLVPEALDAMLSSTAALHERLVWFWHGHFTTNVDATSPELLWHQHQRIRRHAIGNFRTLFREMLTDGAMLHYLDGDGSRGEAPNENLSRESLELFALGRGYSESDVRAGARILSGWTVDNEPIDVRFEPDRHYDRPVTFLGHRGRFDVDDYVELVLARPECAEHVVERLHRHFVSVKLTDARRTELAAVLRNNDYELRPLLAAMLSHPDFLEARGSRTRQPVEWYVAAVTAFGFPTVADAGFDVWQFTQGGQVPYRPPNVAGWPDDKRWSSASQVLFRLRTMMAWELPDRVIDATWPTTDAVLARCGLYSVSQQTRAALDDAIAAQTEYDRGLDLLFVLALTSPEFSVL